MLSNFCRHVQFISHAYVWCGVHLEPAALLHSSTLPCTKALQVEQHHNMMYKTWTLLDALAAVQS